MKMKSDQVNQKTRMIHIRLPEELHKELRIRAAETDTTIQEWVVNTIGSKLDRTDKEETPMD